MALAASTLFVPASANAVVSPGVNVMDWNVCGFDTVHCNNAGKNVIFAGDAIITNWHPAIFMVEEVCESQLAHFANLNGSWDSHYVFFPKVSDGGSCGQIGTAIYTHQAITSHASVTMPVTPSSGARDTVGCVRTTVGPNNVSVEACVTHLDNDSTNVVQRKQLSGTASAWEGAAAWAQDHANGVALIFGGDLNLKPSDSEIAPLYSNILEYKTTQTNQYFHELDQASNQATHGSNKVDYLFYKHSYAQNYVAQPPAFVGTQAGGSDHAILYGQADICSSSSCS